MTLLTLDHLLIARSAIPSAYLVIPSEARNLTRALAGRSPLARRSPRALDRSAA